MIILIGFFALKIYVKRDVYEYKRKRNVTFTVFSEFEPMKSSNTIKSRFEKSITSDFTDLTDAILQNKMAEEYVCSAAGEED